MPRLVVLNPCSGAATGVSDLFAGTAAALVRGGVSAVAAMQWPISDGAACAFARGFYTAIAHGRGVDDATRSGRVAILGTHAGTLEWVTPVMYLRGRDSRLFILNPSLRLSPVPDAAPAIPARDTEPAPRSQAPAADWNWERYAAELNVPGERIDVGRRLVAAISTAIEERGLPWHVAMRKGYVAIQRPGGYNVLVVDLWWNRVPRLAGKIPAKPTDLGLTSPFPHLAEVWTAADHEWGWTVPPGTPLPDVSALIDLVLRFQPDHGPMPASAGHLAAADSDPPSSQASEVTVQQPAATQERGDESADGLGWMQYIIITADRSSGPLKKRHAVLAMVNALRAAGVSAHALAGVIPPSRFLPVEGTLADDDLKEAFISAYPKASGRLNRWFLESPVHDEGRTWVLTKMWGRSTGPVLRRLAGLAPPGSGIGYDTAAGLDSRPDLLALEPTEFEHLIRALFEAIGMKSWVTQADKDGSIDSIAVNDDPIFGGLCVIQAKQYSNVVGVEIVRALAGAIEDKNAVKGVLVTTSWVGKVGRDYAARNGRIEIIEGHQLKAMLQEHLGIDSRIGRPELPPEGEPREAT